MFHCIQGVCLVLTKIMGNNMNVILKLYKLISSFWKKSCDIPLSKGLQGKCRILIFMVFHSSLLKELYVWVRQLLYPGTNTAKNIP